MTSDSSKYAAHWEYNDGSYNFDSCDNLKELIEAVKGYTLDEPNIIRAYVGYTDKNGLFDNEIDAIWGRVKESQN